MSQPPQSTRVLVTSSESWEVKAGISGGNKPTGQQGQKWKKGKKRGSAEFCSSFWMCVHRDIVSYLWELPVLSLFLVMQQLPVFHLQSCDVLIPEFWQNSLFSQLLTPGPHLLPETKVFTFIWDAKPAYTSGIG